MSAAGASCGPPRSLGACSSIVALAVVRCFVAAHPAAAQHAASRTPPGTDRRRRACRPRRHATCAALREEKRAAERVPGSTRDSASCAFRSSARCELLAARSGAAAPPASSHGAPAVAACFLAPLACMLRGRGAHGASPARTTGATISFSAVGFDQQLTARPAGSEFSRDDATAPCSCARLFRTDGRWCWCFRLLRLLAISVQPVDRQCWPMRLRRSGLHRATQYARSSSSASIPTTRRRRARTHRAAVRFNTMLRRKPTRPGTC